MYEYDLLHWVNEIDSYNATFDEFIGSGQGWQIYKMFPGEEINDFVIVVRRELK